MPEVPEPFMSCDQPFHIPAPIAVGCERTAGEHNLKDMQQSVGHLEIALITSLMKCDQDFIREPPAITRCAGANSFAVVFIIPNLDFIRRRFVSHTFSLLPG